MNFKKKIIKGNDGLEDMLADDDMEGQIYKCDHCEFITHLGIILHKKSLITIFGHKHENQKFDTFHIFHEKISSAFELFLKSNC